MKMCLLNLPLCVRSIRIIHSAVVDHIPPPCPAGFILQSRPYIHSNGYFVVIALLLQQLQLVEIVIADIIDIVGVVVVVAAVSASVGINSEAVVDKMKSLPPMNRGQINYILLVGWLLFGQSAGRLVG